MVGNASELASRLKLLSAHGLDVEFVNFAGETHNLVIPAYLARGARFALSGTRRTNRTTPIVKCLR